MNPRFIALISAAAVAGLLGGTWLATQSGRGNDRFAQCRASAIAGGAGSIGGPFELVNGRGETVTEADVITKPSLLYFGFTSCADACPLDVSRNVVAVDILEEQGVEVTPVFISFDPDRDTPDVVAEFAATMHPRMIGLTGSAEQVKAATKAYSAFYSRNPGEDEYYTFTHSTFSYLVLPEQGFVEFFRQQAGPEEMAQTIACYVENA